MRRTLMRAGTWSGSRTDKRLQTLHTYLDLGSWARREAGGVPPHLSSRFDLFSLAIGRVSGRRPLYLEFGVYEGDTFRWWAEHLAQTDARLVGFDSFEGLPEQWKPHMDRGAFAVEQIPDIADPRASFEVGWFDDTLTRFVPPEHDQLIVNIDSDLYSSAKVVLDSLETALVPGTLLYFDEFSDRDHEFRALREFLIRTGVKVRALGMAGGGVHWLFEVVDDSSADMPHADALAGSTRASTD